MSSKNLVFVFLIISSFVFSQKTIYFNYSGKVRGLNNEPLSFCSIGIKNHINKGTISDYEGNFKIVARPNDTLVFSFVGYKKGWFSLAEVKKIEMFLEPLSYKLKTVTIKPVELTAREIALKAINKEWSNNHFDYRDSISILENTNLIMHLTQDGLIKTDSLMNLNVLKTDRGVLKIPSMKRSFFKSFNIKHDKNRDSILKDYIYDINNKYSSYNLLKSLQSYVVPHNKKYFKHKFGEITIFNKRPVYHIKYKRRRGRGYCKGGGMLLIDRQDFSVHYIEHVSRKCLTMYKREVELEGKTTFFKVEIFYKKFNNWKKKLPYKINRSEHVGIYINKKMKKEVYYDSHVEVKNIKKLNYSKQDSLIKYYISIQSARR